MKANEGHIISYVEPGSIADQLEIEEGDELIRINGKKYKDIFDYRYLIKEEELVLLVKKKNGEEWELEVEKYPEDDLGITFKEGLMDKYSRCSNACVFCFIDQNAPGMRDTLYFKDDDARLSFLQGNYITLTNLSDEDVRRILFYKLSPINISIHTMNKQLRVKMLHNRFAGDALDKIKIFNDAGIKMNGQVVLCPDLNDKEELDYTITELEKYMPNFQSLSIVPVGLSRFRKNLYRMRSFTKEELRNTIAQVEKYQERFLKQFGTRFVFLSDEFYINAEMPMPTADYYEGYSQIENGIGIVTSFHDEFENGLKDLEEDLEKEEREEERKKEQKTKRGTIVLSGTLAAPCNLKLIEEYRKIKKHQRVTLVPILNDFYGHKINVTGLITAQDIINQLIIFKRKIAAGEINEFPSIWQAKQEELEETPIYVDGLLRDEPGVGDRAKWILEDLIKQYGEVAKDEVTDVIVPSVSLREGKDTFLDDLTIYDIEEAIHVKVHVCESDGNSMVELLKELE
ncbi:MAG: DUF512 domain-containing protein [Lachnospiraceae bacterium]|nr:DUF512 domain-containing protein [Lachnospiraceae bacterium]